MELWTYEHARTLIPAVIVMCGFGALLHRLLGKKDRKIRMVPFQILAVLLLVVELGKQVLSLLQGYDLYHLPFHFCSIFIFMLPLMAFYRGPHVRRLWAVGSALCGAVTLLLAIYPALIYSAVDVRNFLGDYFCFHTVFFHNLVVFAFVLILALRLHEPEDGEQKAVVWFMLGFCGVSATMAQLLKTNFNNFYSCNIPPLESLRQSMIGVLGTVPTQILYVAVVSALNVAFVLGAYWLYRGIRRILWGKSPSIQKRSSIS